MEMFKATMSAPGYQGDQGPWWCGTIMEAWRRLEQARMDHCATLGLDWREDMGLEEIKEIAELWPVDTFFLPAPGAIGGVKGTVRVSYSVNMVYVDGEE